MCLWQCIKSVFCNVIAFVGGFTLGQGYYYYLLQEIPFPGNSGIVLSLVLSLLLGVSNVACQQLRCISVLKFPMCCGKPGRGVLKAMILTYIVTGPIANMGLNAKEVVRVFACSTQLEHSLSRERYNLRFAPAKTATLGIAKEVEQIKDAFRSIKDTIEALEQEIEDTNETKRIRYENDFIDDLFAHIHRSDCMENQLTKLLYVNGSLNYELLYRNKLQYRCENQLSQATAVCVKRFRKTYIECCELLPNYAEHVVCWQLIQRDVCDLISELTKHNGSKQVCQPPKHPGLGKGFEALKTVKMELVNKLVNVSLQQAALQRMEVDDIQFMEHCERRRSLVLTMSSEMLETRVDDIDQSYDAKETAERVQHAFEEKTVVMRHVQTAMNICMALLSLRIFTAAVNYHDLYLTSIDYDNVFITGYFKRLDDRRMKRDKYTLLPLKKMERNKYIDVYSWSYKESQRSNLLLQILKVALEVVTATTFVMLDRLFYEALEVVRQHAQVDVLHHSTRDLDIQVEGTGLLATMLRNFLLGLTAQQSAHPKVSNAACVPHPRQMPYIYFLKIYGGYTWIVLLLFANPYTLRLKRLICSHFYPRREKERILHLYNDILKKRMKMHKTLRRRAVQSVRAHYLSGDILSLLSMRMKFPHLLGWLGFIPAARMACLICGETQPRTEPEAQARSAWFSCLAARCPFVYCAECWREVGARCLACEPSLAELSDVDSHSDDDLYKY